jgi:hypothetical protein
MIRTGTGATTMKQWDLTTPAARLKQALKDLQVTRDEVTEHWKDETSRKFQENYLDPLGPRIRRTVATLSELAELLAKAERECGSYD